MQEDQPVVQLSKKERKKLKRLKKLEEKEQNTRKLTFKRVVKRTSIIFIILVVVGFIIWWGINFSTKQNAIIAASKEGGAAPNFILPSTTGKTITLSDFRGKKNVLIYFNEGLSCDPCIQQMPELEKKLSKFEKMDVVLLNVVFDPVDQVKQATEKYNLKSPILSYNNARTEVDYNLLPFSMDMGRRAGHTFVLVDKNGKINWRKDYWPARGHMVPDGSMFVQASEIVDNVRTALNK